MPRFQVGDHVVGNAEAGRRYHITNTGWLGYVINVDSYNKSILVALSPPDNPSKNFDPYGPYWVDACCFDHADKGEQTTEGYSCPECNSNHFFALGNGITFRCDDCEMEFELINEDRKLFKTVAMKKFYHTRRSDF